MNFTKIMLLTSICVSSAALHGADNGSGAHGNNDQPAQKSTLTRIQNMWKSSTQNLTWYQHNYPGLVGLHLGFNSAQVFPTIVPYFGPILNFLLLNSTGWKSHNFTTAETAAYAAGAIFIGSWLASDKEGSFESFKKQIPRTTLTLCTGYLGAKALPHALSALGTSMSALGDGIKSCGTALNQNVSPATLIGTVAVGTALTWYGYEYQKDQKNK